ncbi:MAG: hypothetical protein CL816_08160 [Coxiellaceae bacterium]|nr:hypothetical protein [Coxiellaceae bacterium]|tara:strand:- start:5342 stop:6502 length:1161 start_codon:yes stop_codon:yes gene_type:complete
MTSLYICGDHDGSLLEQYRHHPEEAKNILGFIIQEQLSIQTKDIHKITLACASLRQSFSHDLLGMMMNAWQTKTTHAPLRVQTHFNGSIYYSLRAMKQSLQDMKIIDDALITLETFLLPDLFISPSKTQPCHLLQEPSPWLNSELELESWIRQQKNIHGQSFQQWLINQPSDQSSYFRQANVELNWPHLFNQDAIYSDSSKFTTLLLHMHFSAMHHSEITKVIFIDDRPEYARFFHTVITIYPFMIPKNTIFLPVLYTFNSMTNLASEPVIMHRYSIQGQGERYPNIANLCKDWMSILAMMNAHSTKEIFRYHRQIFNANLSEKLSPSKSAPLPNLSHSLFTASNASSGAKDKSSSQTNTLPDISGIVPIGTPIQTVRKRVFRAPA